ncbi:hypothetical protein H0H87_007788 [Tephrocybe sp. NHM501043]|nr:hypothetical protein H0H87_007788 [Tephrocybe sp. NHM501043]
MEGDWEQFKHPNGDIYYYHRSLRLITPENIRDPDMLRFVLEAREDHLQCLHRSVAQLPNDWELVLSDVTDSTAVIGMFSRHVGIEYEWTEEHGLRTKPSPEYFWSHVAEYPSHHLELPPNTEAAFQEALASGTHALIHLGDSTYDLYRIGTDSQDRSGGWGYLSFFCSPD